MEHSLPPFTGIEPLSNSGKYCRLLKAQRYHQWWALKTLRPEYARMPMFRQALRKEFEIGSRFNSPTIVKYVGWEYVPEVGDYCIVEEYVDGITLKNYFAAHYTTKVKMGFKIVREIIQALECCSEQQVVHRDLKPDNIMLTRNGQNVKVIDFGLSDSPDFAILKIPAGNRNYMAPEQGVKGATVDFRTDMYALGKIMEEMHGPKRFDYIIHKCCAENPDRRYSSFDALRADLLKEVNRYRMRKHTKIALLLMPLLMVLAFVLGYSWVGGMVFGYKGSKQAPVGIPEVYYTDHTNYKDDPNYYHLYVPQYNCEIFFLRLSATVPGPISEDKAVDLGLSVKWAPFNLGCKQENLMVPGLLVGFGDAQGHRMSENVNDYCKGDVPIERDVVNRYWGGRWRMPTYREFYELVNRCQWRVVIENGHQPCFVVTGPNGNSIVMAGTGIRSGKWHMGGIVNGCYWTSNFGSDPNGDQAISLEMTRDYFRFRETRICLGLAIRPVLPYETKR